MRNNSNKTVEKEQREQKIERCEQMHQKIIGIKEKQKNYEQKQLPGINFTKDKYFCNLRLTSEEYFQQKEKIQNFVNQQNMTKDKEEYQKQLDQGFEFCSNNFSDDHSKLQFKYNQDKGVFQMMGQINKLNQLVDLKNQMKLRVRNQDKISYLNKQMKAQEIQKDNYLDNQEYVQELLDLPITNKNIQELIQSNYKLMKDNKEINNNQFLEAFDDQKEQQLLQKQLFNIQYSIFNILNMKMNMNMNLKLNMNINIFDSQYLILMHSKQDFSEHFIHSNQALLLQYYQQCQT